jgi:hypothetical protein
MTRMLYPCRGAACCAPNSTVYNLGMWPVVWLLLLPSLLAPSGTWGQKKTSATVDIYFPNYSYPDAVASLSALNPKNTELVIFGENGTTDIRAPLRNGTYEKRHKEGGGDAVEFEWMKPIGSDPGNANFSVAYYTWVTRAGSSSDYGVVQLLQVVDGHVKVVQQILFNLRGSKAAGAFFDAKSNSLKIRGVHGWEHCCPTELDVLRFHFENDLFKQVSYRTVPFEWTLSGRGCFCLCKRTLLV